MRMQGAERTCAHIQQFVLASDKFTVDESSNASAARSIEYELRTGATSMIQLSSDLAVEPVLLQMFTNVYNGPCRRGHGIAGLQRQGRVAFVPRLCRCVMQSTRAAGRSSSATCPSRSTLAAAAAQPINFQVLCPIGAQDKTIQPSHPLGHAITVSCTHIRNSLHGIRPRPDGTCDPHAAQTRRSRTQRLKSSPLAVVALSVRKAKRPPSFVGDSVVESDVVDLPVGLLQQGKRQEVS